MKTQRLSEPEFVTRLYERAMVLLICVPVVIWVIAVADLHGTWMIITAVALVAIIGAGWLLLERRRLPFEDFADEVSLFGQLLIVRRGRDIEKIRLGDLLCVETLRVVFSVQAYLCVRNPEGTVRRIRFTPSSAGRWHPYARFACIERLDRALATSDRGMPMSAEAVDRDLPGNVRDLRLGMLLSNPNAAADPVRSRFFLSASVALLLVFATLALPRQIPWGPAIVTTLLAMWTYGVHRHQVATGKRRAREVHLRDDRLFVQHPNGVDQVDLGDVVGYEIIHAQRPQGRGGVPIPYRPSLDMHSPYSVLELRLARPHAFGDRLRFCPEPSLYARFDGIDGLIAAMAQLARRARRLKDTP